MMEAMSVTEAERIESSTQDFRNIFAGVSVQCVDDREGKDGQTVVDLLSFPMRFEDRFEENNTPLESNVQMSIQCMENQEGIYGQIVFEHVSYSINLPPPDGPDTIDDEGIVMNMT